MRYSIPLLRILALLFLFDYLALTQPVAIGVEGGVRTTGDLTGSLTSESKRYIVGPTMDVRLPKRFSFEFDALYQRIGFTGSEVACCGLGGAIVRERANSWEFPLILKYHLPLGRLHPFVGAGYAPRVVHGTDISSGYFLSDNAPPPVNPYTYFYNQRTQTDYPVTQGLVVSGGVSLWTRHLRLTPEVRYMYWTSPFLNQRESGAEASIPFVSKQNEVRVMFGISWR